jgi:hydrogenase nickel incorporation protein HypA/HybF
MFALVLQQAGQAEAKKVRKINLVIGEMTGVVAECVDFYLGFLSKGTIVEGAVLNVETVPVKATCHNCSETFELREFDFTCPHCGGNSLSIIAGKELFVESIEVE